MINRITGILLFTLLFPGPLFAGNNEIACILSGGNDTTRIMTFQPAGSGFEPQMSFVSLTSELPGVLPHLAVSGDFTGDGTSWMALFMKVPYTPNSNPPYACSSILTLKPEGDRLVPAGTWYNVIDLELDFWFVDHSVAYDFNSDGMDDIAVLYNDPDLETQVIYLFESNGNGFSEPKVYFETMRNAFNFTAVKHALPGDFNHNGKPDIAVFYDYFGTDPGTGQRIYLFESDGSAFSLLPPFYTGTIQDLNFDFIKAVGPGDFNLDGFTDIAMYYSDTAASDHYLKVFRGGDNGFSLPESWYASGNAAVDPADLKYAVTGQFDEDSLPDLAAFYSHSGNGLQELWIYAGSTASFSAPSTAYSGTGISFDNLTVAVTGGFSNAPVVRAAVWKHDRRGAVSFTFDDGAYGAFAHGAACLDAAGIKGTFYIFTDTTKVYDAPLAPTWMISEYRQKGFEIGSHTLNHADLGFLAGAGKIDSIRDLLSASKQILDTRFDQNTLTLSIPFGSFRYEILGLIAETFQSARCSMYGYNLSTPVDFFALRSYPVLSTTPPSSVLFRVGVAEEFGYYLPLMYHDIMDEPFNRDSLIYTYGLDEFQQTVDSVLKRNVWVDTHENVYKYIRERDAMEVTTAGFTADSFAFTVDDGLPDSLFNVELTLCVSLPGSWNENYVTLESAGELILLEVAGPEGEKRACFEAMPDGAGLILHKGVYTGMKPAYTDGLTLSALKVYPNPVGAGDLTIEADLVSGGEVQIILYDARGIPVNRIVLGNQPAGNLCYSIDTGNLSAGLYILQLIQTGKPLHSEKLLKE